MLKVKCYSHFRDDLFELTNKLDSIKKYLGRGLGKRDAAVNQFHKSENKIQRNLKALKKQNKILFKLVKKTSYCKDMHKIKNIKAMKYNSSRNSDIDIYCSDDY